jgi:hypothetical protein
MKHNEREDEKEGFNTHSLKTKEILFLHLHIIFLAHKV